jgi:Glycosyltransferases, probably involved in cell wall biogenesis
MIYILAVAVALFWLAALLQTVLNLKLIPKLREGEAPRNELFVSVVIPARDEERTIGETVQCLLAQRYANFEVIVVNDRSSDRTGEILGTIARESDRLRVVEGVEPPAGWLGKPWALQQGASAARGELLLFVDADIIYAPAALAAAVAYLERTGVAFVALFPYFEMKGFWENVLMPLLPMTGFVFAPAWLASRVRNENLAMGGGPGNLIRRPVYDAISQHESLKNAVIDDIGLARRVHRAGHAVSFVRADDMVSVRMYHGFREIIDGFTKNVYKVIDSIPVVMAMMIGGLAVIAFPYILALAGLVRLTSGGVPTDAELASFVAIALITLTRVVMFRALRYSTTAALFAYPLSLAVGTYLLARSTFLTGLRGRVTWRGRTYEKTTRFGE